VLHAEHSGSIHRYRQVRAEGLAQGVTLRYRGSTRGLPEYELTFISSLAQWHKPQAQSDHG